MFNRIRNRIVRNADTGAGSGGSAEGQQSPQGSAPAGQASGEISDGGFDLNAINIWQQKPIAQPQMAVQQQAPQQQQQPDPMGQFDQHVKGLNFGKFEMDSEQLQRFVQTGDTEGFNKSLTGMMQGVYKQVMLDASRMMATQREQIVEDALAKAKQMYGSQRTFDDLVKEVPLAGNPNVAPIAQAVFKQFQSQGKSHADAVKGVKSFLNAIRGTKETDIGLPPRPSQGNLRNNTADAATDEEIIDWTSFASASN